MIDVASIVLGGFQEDLVSAFGNSMGWAFGHLIILVMISLLVLGLRERDHIINNSGFGRNQAIDGFATLSLTVLLYYIYTSTFDFDSTASVAISVGSSLSLRWMVTVLG
ncbi:MAG: hypothetical protein CMA88_01840 [Euryarchaeota archaeon]|nr:hypothetical protein [Euryarchaeota archaeon]